MSRYPCLDLKVSSWSGMRDAALGGRATRRIANIRRLGTAMVARSCMKQWFKDEESPRAYLRPPRPNSLDRKVSPRDFPTLLLTTTSVIIAGGRSIGVHYSIKLIIDLLSTGDRSDPDVWRRLCLFAGTPP